MTLPLPLKSSSSTTRMISMHPPPSNNSTTTMTLRYKQTTPPDKKDCVSRRWTFEYQVTCLPKDMTLSKDDVPVTVLHLLQVAACLESFDQRLLSVTLEGDRNISQQCHEAVTLGMIVPQKEDSSYMFLNTEYQEAIHELIHDKSMFHLQLGRKLVQHLEQHEIQQYIYIILRQFHEAKCVLTSRKEKHAIAGLCHEAAQYAVAESNFGAASMYLAFGMELLGEYSWKDNYTLSLALSNAAMEVEYCLANFVKMDQLVTLVLDHAHSFHDSILARATRVSSLGGRGLTLNAVQEGLHILQQLGVVFPKRTTKLHVAWELLQTKKLLRGRTNEMILRMPLMSNADKICAMQMLNLVFPNVFKTDPLLAFLVSSKMVVLSLEHGLSAISSVAFSMYGTMYCAFTSNKNEGYRFGQVGLALLERFKSREWLPRVYFSVYGNINRLRDRMQDLIGPLHQGFRVGMETGDMEFAMLNASLHVAFMLFGGPSLPSLEAQAMEYLPVMQSHQQASAVAKTQSILQLVQNLMGKTDDAFHLEAEPFDESLASSRANNLLTVWCHFQKLILRYILSDYERAEQEAVSFRSLRKYLHFKSSFGFISLLEGLALLAVCNDRPRKVKRRHLRVVRGNLQQLQKESLVNPQDIAGKALLLEAELENILGNKDVARYKYVCAVAVTRDSGISLDHSLACERYSRFLKGTGDDAAATVFLRQAHESYQEWGAVVKVKQLEAELPETLATTS